MLRSCYAIVLQVILAVSRISRAMEFTMFTYLEPLAGDSRSESENRELLAYWDTTWREAGWETQVLNASHVPREARHYIESLPLLEKSKSLLRKWFAWCHHGAGWLAANDLFALPQFSPREPFPTFTLFDKVSPVLVSSAIEGCEHMTGKLLEHAKNATIDGTTVFWTDTLAFLDLLDHVSLERRVIKKLEYDCGHRSVRNRWAIQVPPVEVLFPTDVVAAAQAWMDHWTSECTSSSSTR